jgi:plastin-1
MVYLWVSTQETRSFSEHINEMLGNDPDLRRYLPINPASTGLFDAVGDGILLCKYINKIRPGTIDERKICVKPVMNTFEKSQNHILAIEAAKKLGLKIVNIGPNDLMAKTPHLILGIVWQLIRLGLMDGVSVGKHPEMIALMNPGEDMNSFVNLPPEQTLLRWFNYHLKRAGHPRVVRNFTTDIQDSENYLVLLNQLGGQKCPLYGMQETDLIKRAELMLQNADRLGCRKFVAPTDVVNGNPNLNLAFVANLFNQNVCLGSFPKAETSTRGSRNDCIDESWGGHEQLREFAA